METDNTTAVATGLQFKRLTRESLPLIVPFLHQSGSLSCDYSVGGIYMWIDYFKYHYCIINDTLLIKGVAEDNRHEMAFSLPMGRMPLAQSVDMLRDYCEAHQVPLVFSAITEERLADFEALRPREVTELTHWGDYIYHAQSLATFKGKALKQKRNHVNHFMAQYPQTITTEITPELLPAVCSCFEQVCAQADQGDMAEYEREQVWHVLKHMDEYPFETMCLTVDGQVLGFTMGEVIGNVMLDHIEKSLHTQYSGVNEVLCRNFAAHIIDKHPEVEYINREDDAGDEGLRQSKLSYDPVQILKKYDVIF